MASNPTTESSKGTEVKIIKLEKEGKNLQAWDNSVREAALTGGYMRLLQPDANIEVQCSNNDQFDIDYELEHKLAELDKKHASKLKILELTHARSTNVVAVTSPSKQAISPSEVPLPGTPTPQPTPAKNLFTEEKDGSTSTSTHTSTPLPTSTSTITPSVGTFEILGTGDLDVNNQIYKQKLTEMKQTHKEERKRLIEIAGIMHDRQNDNATEADRRVARDYAVKFLDFFTGRPVGDRSPQEQGKKLFTHTFDHRGDEMTLDFAVESKQDAAIRIKFDSMIRASLKDNIPNSVIAGVSHGNIYGLITRIRDKYDKFDRIEQIVKVKRGMESIIFRAAETFEMYLTRFDALITQANDLNYEPCELDKYIEFRRGVLESTHAKAVEIYNQKSAQQTIETVDDFIAAVGPELRMWEKQEKITKARAGNKALDGGGGAKEQREQKAALDTRFSTRVCIDYNEGGCSRSGCRFAHTKVSKQKLAELRKRRDEAKAKRAKAKPVSTPSSDPSVLKRARQQVAALKEISDGELMAKHRISKDQLMSIVTFFDTLDNTSPAHSN
jgi:hypothetical protein